MTFEELAVLAETAEERAKGYLREALADPDIKAAVHSRYVPHVLAGPAVANDQPRAPSKGRKRA
ncbi:hypothetical protein FV226_26535 [Methylobacterium sp. WL12]|uniref:hypothetical protein n=1 Tax=Methylobacterium sp. WL12 TaxID=2603890 RepID=UPI0011C882F9|nr:hypothetical protein [Methylobacterium sp. WL12]TXM64451.1 hypothetical protein FV226_26535 [Methylobacterium sp. WL12]